MPVVCTQDWITHLVLNVLVGPALQEVSVKDPAVVQRGWVVERGATLLWRGWGKSGSPLCSFIGEQSEFPGGKKTCLVLSSGGDSVLLGYKFDDLWLVEEYGLVEGRGSVGVSGQRQALGGQQLLHHRDHARGHRVM